MLLNDEVARVATALSQLVQDREGETRARVARCLGMVCMGDAGEGEGRGVMVVM